MTIKFCKKCKTDRSLEDFYTDKTGKLKAPCKVCVRAYQAEYQAKNKDKRAKVNARYRNRANELHKGYRMARYGISVEEFNNLLDIQNNKCKICSIDLNKSPKGPCVDHCHDTGKVRGLLCMQCNLGLGNFKDSLEFLINAVNYLQH